MTPTRPPITVLVPVRNEERDIEDCLECLARQSIGPSAFEVLVIDGMSEDATLAAVTRATHRFGLDVRVLTNPGRVIPVALNLGLAEAAGEYLVRVDARSRVPADYLEACVATLAARPDVGVVGGAQVAAPRAADRRSRSIARALNNRWLMGLSRYRRDAHSGPADTVWMGAYRSAEVRGLGGWNEDRLINEDYELNQRYRSTGWTVWFDASIRSGYLPRASVRALARQYELFGRFKADGWVQGGRVTARHAVLLAVPPLTVGAVAVVAAAGGWVPALLGCGLSVVIVDATGGAGPAPVVERLGALGVNAVIGASWWWGVVAGWVASRHGRRPHSAALTRSTR